MKVLYVFEEIDAGERHQLLGMVDHGLDVRVICDPAAKYQDDLRRAGITVEHIQWGGRIDREAIARVRAIVLHEKPALVHVFVKIALSNVIRAIRDLPPKLVAYRGIVGNLHWLNPSSRRSFLNRRVDAIICVCEAIRQDLLANRFLGWRVPMEKVVTIHKGHYADFWRKPPLRLSDYGVPGDGPVIGCVAQMRKRKGIPALIHALEQLENPRARLVLVGDVADREVARCIRQSPARDRIHQLGWQDDASRIAGAFDIFVLPALRREGLPRAVIEAMCQNVPPVVTRAGGSPELVEDGVSGLVVPPGDADALAGALGSLLSNPEARRRMGQAAEQRIRECFTPERTVRETLALYEKLTGWRPAQAAPALAQQG
ncbi:glycosyltransferase family 4 protein [Gammaproteobacteria bacterium AB-CW1]|uniref:Glycosyltransferase family 4 protein n=1 Tax=Natronospira elongata TaxID=3110268 RepID=A0AAP6MLQ1_9GAMM|nr:glycosyltransferase family 4 protein [Gammaproteobacteria bacterium AB-CW1]